MSIAQSLPPGDKSLVPNTSQTKTYTVEEKYYTLSTNYYDIGDYLSKLNMTSYQTLFITIKGGSYKWDKVFTMPYNSKLVLIGEDCGNDGKNNKVSILIGEKNTQNINNEQMAKNVRLIVQDGCTVKIKGINFFEKINDNRKITRDDRCIGIFNVSNAKFYLTESLFEAADSPIINIRGQSIAYIYFGHTFFERNPMSCNTEIKVVDTLTGWGFSGNKAFVSKSHTQLGNGCVLQPSKKIELID